jgi:hypothetical protein
MSADTETHYDRPSNGPNFRDDDMVALGVVSEFEKNRSLAAAGLADRSSVKCFPVIVWFETKLKGNGCLDRFSPYRIRLKHTRDTSRHRIGFERGNEERTIRVPPSRPVPQDSPPPPLLVVQSQDHTRRKRDGTAGGTTAVIEWCRLCCAPIRASKKTDPTRTP